MPLTKNNFKTAAILVALTLINILVFSDESKNVGSSFSIKTTRLECIRNPLRLTNTSCKLKPVSWNKSVVHMEAYLVEPVRNVSLRVELYKYTNQFRPFVINETVNVCKWLETRERHNYAGWFLNMMVKFSNVNHSCPYTGIVRADEMFFDTTLATFVIPSGTYRFVFTFFEGFPYIHLGTIKAVGIVKEVEDYQAPSSRDRLY